MLKTLGKPKVLLPILMAAALLAVVFSVSDLGKVWGYVRNISIPVTVVTLGLAAGYMVLKGIQFHFFLEGIHERVSWRQLTLAFAIGEMTLPVPAGIYAQNYVLRRVAGEDFARTSAATTAILAAEAVVSLLVLAILGIPGWDWLRPTILAFVSASGLGVAALLGLKPARDLVRRTLRLGPMARVADEFMELASSLQDLFTLRTAARAIPLATLYLFAVVSAYYLVTRAIGIENFSYEAATTVYLFAIAVVLVSPFSTNLGVAEAGGVGAMEAWGYSSTEALASLIAFRMAWTGATWLVGGSAVLLFRGEFTQAERQQGAT